MGVDGLIIAVEVDSAAGAVLIAAIMAAIAGGIIFVPKGLAFLGII